MITRTVNTVHARVLKKKQHQADRHPRMIPLMRRASHLIWVRRVPGSVLPFLCPPNAPHSGIIAVHATTSLDHIILADPRAPHVPLPLPLPDLNIHGKFLQARVVG